MVATIEWRPDGEDASKVPVHKVGSSVKPSIQPALGDNFPDNPVGPDIVPDALEDPKGTQDRRKWILHLRKISPPDLVSPRVKATLDTIYKITISRPDDKIVVASVFLMYLDIVREAIRTDGRSSFGVAEYNGSQTTGSRGYSTMTRPTPGLRLGAGGSPVSFCKAALIQLGGLGGQLGSHRSPRSAPPHEHQNSPQPFKPGASALDTTGSPRYRRQPARSLRPMRS